MKDLTVKDLTRIVRISRPSKAADALQELNSRGLDGKGNPVRLQTTSNESPPAEELEEIEVDLTEEE